MTLHNALKAATAALATTVLAIALQNPNPIPPANDPTHPGQPLWCQNDGLGGHTANCKCKPSSMEDCGKAKEPPPDDPEADEGSSESAHCTVFCRPKACRCSSACDRTTH